MRKGRKYPEGAIEELNPPKSLLNRLLSNNPQNFVYLLTPLGPYPIIT